jgi:hypothetical protein
MMTVSFAFVPKQVRFTEKEFLIQMAHNDIVKPNKEDNLAGTDLHLCYDHGILCLCAQTGEKDSLKRILNIL